MLNAVTGITYLASSLIAYLDYAVMLLQNATLNQAFWTVRVVGYIPYLEGRVGTAAVYVKFLVFFLVAAFSSFDIPQVIVGLAKHEMEFPLAALKAARVACFWVLLRWICNMRYFSKTASIQRHTKVQEKRERGGRSCFTLWHHGSLNRERQLLSRTFEDIAETVRLEHKNKQTAEEEARNQVRYYM